jgi:hypothetical protein
MLNSYLVSAIRTGVPLLVGWISSWLVARGIGVDEASEDWLISFLTFAFSLGYYLLVRALERVNPRVGWLLGVPVQPTYLPPVVTPPVDGTTG